MHSGWKRKNKSMNVSEGQIKGMIAVCLILAIIPFFNYYSLFVSYKFPVFIDQSDNSLAIEVVARDQQKGIYFVGSDTSLERLLKDAGIDTTMLSLPDFKLKNGMKINIKSSLKNYNINVAKMEGAGKLALGMPLDVNQVTEEELLLIKGIGVVTAKEILNLRRKAGWFENITQITEIRGIKEKRLKEIRKYLYVEKSSR
ncbi:MAG: hypothetical protein APR62_10105 [Smithella sp. SDB]|nr:MAG: hypothetical protein APR62_10105 [Smithella sp. SDB]